MNVTPQLRYACCPLGGLGSPKGEPSPLVNLKSGTKVPYFKEAFLKLLVPGFF